MPADQPKDLDDVKKDAKLSAAVLAYMKRSYNDENYLFYFDKGNIEALYPKYLSEKAKKEVNLPHKMFKEIRAIGEKGDWKHKDWPKLIKSAKVEIKKVVRSDVLTPMAFYKSKEYKDYVAKNKMGDPKKAAKLLGISDEKLLKSAMEAQACGDEKEAKKLFAELIKKEKLNEKAEKMMKDLDKSGLV